MIFGKEKSLKEAIIKTGRNLHDLRLVAATSGNLSARIEDNNILVTATGTSLGNLTYDDILKVDLSKEDGAQKSRLTTEFILHKLIYKNFPAKVIIHCHPPLVNGYFAVSANLKILTFESKLYLGDIPVVEQETPAITKPQPVIDALKSSNLAVIKNHGVVAIADEFTSALYLIEMLEEAVKTAAIGRLFKKELLDDLDKELKEDLTAERGYLMFSQEHIQAIVDLVNQDEFLAKKGQEQDLTLQLAIKLDGLDKVYKFNFEKGKITKLEHGQDAPYIISAPFEVWELVFLGKLDPFVATTQGRMKLKGNLGQLSRWYVPFSRLFELFRHVKIK